MFGSRWPHRTTGMRGLCARMDAGGTWAWVPPGANQGAGASHLGLAVWGTPRAEPHFRKCIQSKVAPGGRNPGREPGGWAGEVVRGQERWSAGRWEACGSIAVRSMEGAGVKPLGVLGVQGSHAESRARGACPEPLD